MSKSMIPQHQRLAMGEKCGYAKGGSVKLPAAPRSAPLKSGKPDSPMEGVKRANGIPGMKRGGSC